MQFSGGFEQLCKLINAKQPWTDVNSNQKQLRLKNGVIVNFYLSTGTIQFQGTGPIEEVKKAFAARLGSDTKKTKDMPGIAEPEEKQDREVYEPNNKDSEIVIGLVAPVGTELSAVVQAIEDRLKHYEYTVQRVRVSVDVIEMMCTNGSSKTQTITDYERISRHMDLGNQIREKTGDHSILAHGIASAIMNQRDHDESGTKPHRRRAYIVQSLKHPKEIEALRDIYSNGFYLIGISSEITRRKKYLTTDLRMTVDEADQLIQRDMNEQEGFGQHTRDAFHLADFFVDVDNNSDKFKNSIWRILDLIFGNPFLTPTFDEFAMFMAFTSALRSADLSRQVGAVIARDFEIIASGANDCPKYGGGLYWPVYDVDKDDFVDAKDGRDYTRGFDSNKHEQEKIIDDIAQCLGLNPEDREKLFKCRIRDITEYGRVVHAEMEALMMCARNSISTRKATLYCTTFPCHNCAKHIIAAGIEKVVYVEPYPKSKAFDFHSDSITSDVSKADGRVQFAPFVGVGPRRFFELFSISMGSGYNVARKDEKGNVLNWEAGKANVRSQMWPFSYLEKEYTATMKFDMKRKEFNYEKDGK